MAFVIKDQIHLIVDNLDYRRQVTNTLTDWAGTKFSAHVQPIGTAFHEEIEIPLDILSGEEVWFRNLSEDEEDEYGTTIEAGDVEVGFVINNEFVPMLYIKPGRTAHFPPARIDFYAKAINMPVLLEFFVAEE